jgi:hypothetical protein
VSVAKTEWFQRAMAEKRFIVGKPFIGPITGKLVSVLVEPVWGENKELRGFLGLPLDLERFNPRIPADSMPEGTRYGFISADGIMVWRSRPGSIGKYVGTRRDRGWHEIRDGDAETLERMALPDTMPSSPSRSQLGCFLGGSYIHYHKSGSGHAQHPRGRDGLS